MFSVPGVATGSVKAGVWDSKFGCGQILVPVVVAIEEEVTKTGDKEVSREELIVIPAFTSTSLFAFYITKVHRLGAPVTNYQQ